jgi:hypothetical protein
MESGVIYMSPPPALILSQLIPLYILTPSFVKIHLFFFDIDIDIY